MAAGDVAICNVALRHLGVSTTISSMTERTKEAIALNALYDQVIGEVLRDFPWPFTRTFVALALVGTDPTTEWGFSYRYPAACSRFVRVLSGRRNDTLASRIPFRQGNDSQGQLVYCDLANAVAEYHATITTPARFAPDFVQAAALLLAGYAAPSITKGDDAKFGDRALKLYQWRAATAQQTAVNEDIADPEPESSAFSARN